MKYCVVKLLDTYCLKLAIASSPFRIPERQIQRHRLVNMWMCTRLMRSYVHFASSFFIYWIAATCSGLCAFAVGRKTRLWHQSWILFQVVRSQTTGYNSWPTNHRYPELNKIATKRGDDQIARIGCSFEYQLYRWWCIVNFLLFISLLLLFNLFLSNQIKKGTNKTNKTK